MTETELIYGKAGNLQLRGRLYLPETPPPYPVVVDVHGGAWSSGDLESGRYYDQWLSAAGICVLAINFRHGPDFQHPAASADIAAAVRYAKSTIEYTTIGLIGSSSGGHLALYTALLPDIDAHCQTLIAEAGAYVPGDGASADVDFVVALWPVSNPIARYQYVLARQQDGQDTWGPNFTPDRLAAGHRAYFGTEAVMHEVSIQRLVSAREYTALPRILIVQPELDLNVPVFMSQTLYGALLEAGADVQYNLYTGVAHGFAAREGPKTEACLRAVAEFIAG